ncbi:unnamed protein product [Rhizophagus irregularis]|nr:unnamed protein product [Rhizophagus irregularis]
MENSRNETAISATSAEREHTMELNEVTIAIVKDVVETRTFKGRKKGRRELIRSSKRSRVIKEAKEQ